MAKFSPIDVTVPHVAYAALGGFVVLFGMFSLLLRERLYIGEACWAFIFGVVIGPYGANIFNPRGWGGASEETSNTITLELTRVVLAIGVFAIGVELPKAYMRRHWKSLFFLLGPIMIWGWFVSAGLIFALIPGLTFVSSLAVAACLTPTDPILAAAVIGGKYADKHVPAHIRHLLAAESGCNDGAAFPFLYIALYLILDSTTKEALRHWFLELWLYQVILGVVIGAAIGFAFRHMMKFSERRSLIDRHSYVAQYVSLALLTIGITTLLGSDDLLSAFACGAAFAWDGFFNRQTEESVFSSVIDLLFNVAAFVYVGAWMPFASFNDPAGTTLQAWRLIVLALCVLLLRRLPIMVALYRWIPDVKTLSEAVFSGHFGPIGIGAVFISTLATEVLQESPLAHGEGGDPQVRLLVKVIQPICAFMVLCSIAVHGLSIPSFSLGRRVHSVSRTWSRHTTATAQGPRPDWMDNVRHAGGGVVVNRDPRRLEEGDVDAEKESDDLEMPIIVDGQGRPREEIDVKGHTSESPTATGSMPGSRDEEKDAEERRAEVAAGTRPEGDVPPDGSETVTEWQEGHHRIIERRAGPGEEVEVEVIRNVHGEERSAGAYRGPEAAVRGLVDKLRGVPRAVELDVEAMGRGIEERLGDFAHPRPPADDAAPAGDEDEGWASEHSEAPTERRPRSTSPKAKKSKRRASGRKGLMGFMRGHRPHGAQPLDAELGAGEGADADYSSPSAARPSSAPRVSTSDARELPAGATDYAYPRPSTASRPGRRSRVDSLRMAHSSRPSRDASPARSVRFAEERERGSRPGSGTSTPAGAGAGAFGEPAAFFGDEVAASPAPLGEDESPGTKVTFDLPEPAAAGPGGGSGGGNGNGNGSGSGSGNGNGNGRAGSGEGAGKGKG
ncbi:Sodium/hydrogen exchanger family-domain-containing protein [Mycena belliarum]|uniref:Sodium/hydrogen exchanger family-domain-containing protein n=1 Tax=Mycena belliarum TaxID=1033014 RepID=A0AAD6XP47_9AGAR|nr:Sodium/hydrogen exchanger family-domain-containing protein [Mycena belliae]